MKWKSPLANEYPSTEKQVLIEFYSGDFESRFIGVLDDNIKRWWDRNIKRWLDETESPLPPDIEKEAAELYPMPYNGSDQSSRTSRQLCEAQRAAHISCAKMYSARIADLEDQLRKTEEISRIAQEGFREAVKEVEELKERIPNSAIEKCNNNKY